MGNMMLFGNMVWLMLPDFIGPKGAIHLMLRSESFRYYSCIVFLDPKNLDL